MKSPWLRRLPQCRLCRRPSRPPHGRLLRPSQRRRLRRACERQSRLLRLRCRLGQERMEMGSGVVKSPWRASLILSPRTAQGGLPRSRRPWPAAVSGDAADSDGDAADDGGDLGDGGDGESDMPLPAADRSVASALAAAAAARMQSGFAVRIFFLVGSVSGFCLLPRKQKSLFWNFQIGQT